MKRKVLLFLVVLGLLVAIGFWQQRWGQRPQENIPYGAVKVAASKKGGTVSSNDVYVLSKIITGEARG
ncbi:MAG TPA: hypothetical protein GX532_04070, partial [Clostridia bacterium]|nr:hypothetical protein [Clostridia bacterium]